MGEPYECPNLVMSISNAFHPMGHLGFRIPMLPWADEHLLFYNFAYKP